MIKTNFSMAGVFRLRVSGLRWLVLLALPVTILAHAEAAPKAGGVTQARQAIAERKAAFTLTESNFKPVVAIAKGQEPFDAARVQQRLERLIFLVGLLEEPWPESSNRGTPDTQALPAVWTDADKFKSLLDEYRQDLQALAAVAAATPADSAAFKKAVATVAQDCKQCHDSFKAD